MQAIWAQKSSNHHLLSGHAAKSNPVGPEAGTDVLVGVPDAQVVMAVFLEVARRRQAAKQASQGGVAELLRGVV